MTDFWKDKTVLVTGGHGFLGRHVVIGLQTKHVGPVVVPRSRDFDLRFPDEIERLLRREEPDVIIHCAATSGGIVANQAMPGDFFYDNAAMGMNILEEARLFEVPKVVMIGSVCSYPRDTPVPFREENLWDGYPEETNGPYGMAKRMAIVQSDAYRKRYGLNSIYLLLANLYGPGDNFDEGTSHVIPALIRRFTEARDTGAESVTVWGTGNASREFLFVMDAVDAILLASEHYDSSEPVNVGTGRETTIKEVANWIRTFTLFDGEIIFDDTKPDGQPRRCIDVSKAKERFGFSARTTFADGLAETINWYLTR